MSPPLASIKPSFRTPPLLELLVEFAVVVLVFALDVRDLSFKTQWIGPKDTFSFTAIGTQVLQKAALAPAFNVTVPGGAIARASGWGSFFETCDALHPIGGSFFLHAMGENCRFGPRHANVSVPKIVFVSSLRADSVAWAACKLLRADRRPVVCRSRMVLQFEVQYNMAATPFRVEYASRDSTKTTRTAVSLEEDSWVSTPGSAAEDEVLELLAVISESAPIGRVVCVEGFIYDGPGRYVASIFGCGSPNRYHSAFVGIHATAMAQFHQNKSWLTADWLHVLGVPLLIRQNCLSLFNVVLSSDGNAGETLTLVHETLMNFSSSGALYVLVILIDVVLLVISLLSTIEILRFVIVPVVKELRRRGNGASGERNSSLPSDYEGVLTCPVIRSTSFAVLTLFSQLISWLVVLANSVIWSWTEATPGKIQAYLSTLRFWIVALIACNVLWNALVTLSERRAYEFAKRTRVAVVEILFVASAVAYARRDELFAIGGTKYGIEGQRQLDTTSFQGGFLAFGNAYPQRLDGLQVTSGDILKIIYEPLGKMIGWCLFGAAAFAISRYAINSALMHWNRTNARAALYVQPSEEPTEVIKSSVAGTSSTSKSSRVAVESTLRDHGPDAGDDAVTHTVFAAPAQYHRLPFEEALNTPIRARSLLRNTSRIETMTSDRQQVCMSALVEHGVIVANGRLRTRVGFVGTVQDFVLARRYRMHRNGDGARETASVLHPLG
ncbi:hypothetical protein PINS_up013858 [Pythium insidiosum]|nr:hypothetical protein PINS_up013858 [Pythium insidiosum]